MTHGANWAKGEICFLTSTTHTFWKMNHDRRNTFVHHRHPALAPHASSSRALCACYHFCLHNWMKNQALHILETHALAFGSICALWPKGFRPRKSLSCPIEVSPSEFVIGTLLTLPPSGTCAATLEGPARFSRHYVPHLYRGISTSDCTPRK